MPPERATSVSLPAAPTSTLPDDELAPAKSTPETTAPALMSAPSIKTSPAPRIWPLTLVAALITVRPWLEILPAVRVAEATFSDPADKRVEAVIEPAAAVSVRSPTAARTIAPEGDAAVAAKSTPAIIVPALMPAPVTETLPAPRTWPPTSVAALIVKVPWLVTLFALRCAAAAWSAPADRRVAASMVPPDAVSVRSPRDARAMLRERDAAKSTPETMVPALMLGPEIAILPAPRIWPLTLVAALTRVLPWLETLPAVKLAAAMFSSPADNKVSAVIEPAGLVSVRSPSFSQDDLARGQRCGCRKVDAGDDSAGFDTTTGDVDISRPEYLSADNGCCLDCNAGMAGNIACNKLGCGHSECSGRQQGIDVDGAS